jgi:ferric-dicitrate binding protein FerR (iron transport regulator)
MKTQFNDDTFLARWLNNNLTNEELVSFKQTKEYKEYTKINGALDRFEAPKFRQKAVLQSINDQLKPTKVKKLVPNWMYAAAASIALLFSVVYFLTNSEETFSTSFGEQLAVVLPDGSEVQLNSKSTLTFKKSDWFDGNRTLQLDGEGYFKVQKGSKFSVSTDNGTVSVLGTEFNVKTDESYFEVKCFEGKVQVKNDSETAILTQGLSFKKIETNLSVKGEFAASSPNWLLGETSFTNTPLKFVLKELEKQYQVDIISSSIDVNTLYTGTFSNKNLDLALQTICIPLSIEYSISDTSITLSKK